MSHVHRRGAAADPMDRGRGSRSTRGGWSRPSTDPDDLGVTETLFTVGNGYLGMRGNPEEGRDAYAHGTFVNGFHETWPIRHAEAAFGFARTGQTIVNVPDAKLVKLYVDDEPLNLQHRRPRALRAVPRLPRRRAAALRACGGRRPASGSRSTRPGWCR